MKFMNEWEIEEALRLAKTRPSVQEFLPYVQFLSDWKDVVNANSDGWPYWSGAVKVAKRLIVEVENLVHYIRYGIHAPTHLNVTVPDHKRFRSALSPIKGFATKHKLVLA